ncbi:RNA polymerase sigma factor [Pseudofrankia sp. BMG5.37]|uniref:RNA polymerase sigma factor n=1 Tax=Pseudofrankia sp. BMG5.37 TaxID=3050035 RepID=UPI002895CBF7|nr:sigma-70 family RNA polymerase sigma factor [Pseudofrankia sp. BMG5.37]
MADGTGPAASRDGGAAADGAAGDRAVRDRAVRDRAVGDLLRGLAPAVLGGLLRRYPGQFDLCEDAVQEALLAAATGWPRDGVPDNPRGWLAAVAARRMIDTIRAEAARRRREEGLAVATPASELVAGAADAERPADQDDSLRLLFLCCHPALSPPSQVALTLRAVGGLTTAQIATAFLVPEATMAQRISRAKQGVRAAGAEFRMPAAGTEFGDRLRAVMHVLYLIFNEGYTASEGTDLTRPGLSDEAVRLTRWLARLLPDGAAEHAEVLGLLALMLLTDARRPARADADGRMVPLASQDRSRWDRALIAEGVELLEQALPAGPVGAYQLQAAIAAVHAEGPDTDSTDWPQILGLYDVLERIAPNPMVALARAVALAQVAGPSTALAAVDALAEADRRMSTHHRLLAVRAHLHEMAGDPAAAGAAFRAAARRTASEPERRYLLDKAANQGGGEAGRVTPAAASRSRRPPGGS